MRPRRKIFLLFSAAAFVLALLMYLSAGERARELSAPQPSAGNTRASGGYCLRSEGERLYVVPLAGGEATLIDGVCVSDLPEVDRRQLAVGLTVPDESALLALLEDYTG